MCRLERVIYRGMDTKHQKFQKILRIQQLSKLMGVRFLNILIQEKVNNLAIKNKVLVHH